MTDVANTDMARGKDCHNASAISRERSSQSAEQQAVRVAISSLQSADWPRIAGEDTEHTRLLAELGAKLPPIIVQRSTMRVIDGMHRLRAAELRGETEIDVVFFGGDDKESFFLAVKANIAHGLPLSLADRTAAARRIVRSHHMWSDAAISEVTGLDAKTIAALRHSDEEVPQANARIGRDGRVRPVAAAEGRRRASEVLTENPEASLRQVAQVAGVSLGTASDVRRRIRSGQDPVPSGRPTAGVRQLRPAGPTGRRGPAIPDTEKQDYQTLLERLRKDPSLRFSQSGRALLRALEIQAVRNEELERLLDSVPMHCAQTVAELAGECSRFWTEFSSQLVQRGRVGELRERGTDAGVQPWKFQG